ncbi:MAG: class I SAM-dependent methyltransferase [Anaerolineae bacterium]|jgi:ubiquinone/menaquinone biosynthesis C-methylase UbiE
MDIFDGLAPGYDLGMLPLELAGLRGLRRRTFPSLKGRVLELGVGTGANLPLYGSEARVVGLDVSGPMMVRARSRLARASISLVQADAQHLPFADRSFDVVSSSLLFCSVVDPAQALAEARRTLASEGRLVLVEHTRGEGFGAWLTDLLNPLWITFSKVCHLNRQTTQSVAAAGFRLIRVERRLLGILRVIEGVK